MHGVELEGSIQAFVSLIIAFMVIYKSIPVLIKIAYLKDLYDKPDGERKVHTNYIPTLGGIGIFFALSLGFLFSGFASSLHWTPYMFGVLVILFFCGLKDDLVGLSPLKKLSIEISVCSILLLGGGISIKSLGGVFGVEEIPLWFAFIISLFTMIVIINSFNLIDGIDGLAGGIGAIASFAFSIGFFISGDLPLAVLGLTLGVVLIGYLIHNFHPASIFMGDTGSLIIGFLLSVMAINFIDLSIVDSYKNLLGTSSPVMPVAILALPLYDTLRSFTRRISKGNSPFDADSDHVHHNLLKMGWGQKNTVLYLYFSCFLIILVGVLTSQINVNFSLGAVLLTTLLVFPTNGFKRSLTIKLGFDIEKAFRPKTNVELFEHLKDAQEKAKRTRQSAFKSEFQD